MQSEETSTHPSSGEEKTVDPVVADHNSVTPPPVEPQPQTTKPENGEGHSNITK